jgi:hypothetical protein
MKPFWVYLQRRQYSHLLKERPKSSVQHPENPSELQATGQCTQPANSYANKTTKQHVINRFKSKRHEPQNPTKSFLPTSYGIRNI